MPFVVYYMGLIAILAALAWRVGDHRRAGGLAAILLLLPVAFFSYNYLTPPAGNHAMTLLWLVAPVVLYKQGLIKLAPAISGEFIAIPYLLVSLGLLDAHAALFWGDFFGLTMIALIAGPLIAQLIGMAAARAAFYFGSGDLVHRHSHHCKKATQEGA